MTNIDIRFIIRVMKGIFLGLGILFSSIAVGKAEPNSIVLNPIYKQILTNNPSLTRAYIMKLTYIISKVADKYDLEPSLIAAILAQESMYKLNAVNPLSHDYSIAQINYNTIKLYKLDKKRLLKDLEYAVESCSIILRGISDKYAYKEKYWWTRYHSKTPSRRLLYKRKVLRFM